MRAIGRGANRVLDAYYRLTAYIGGILMAGVMLMITVEVALRYFIGYAIPTVTDVSGYALFIVTFLVAAWVLKEGGHVTVDIVVTRVEGRNRQILDTIGLLVGAGIAGLITYQSSIDVVGLWSRGDVIGYPLVLPRGGLFLVLPVGCFFLTLQCLIQAWSRATAVEPEAEAEAVVRPVGFA